MAISLGSLVVDLVAKTGGFIEGMTRARVEAKNAAKDIQDSFASLGQSASSLLAPFGEMGGVLGQAVGGIGNTVRSVTESLSPLIGELGLIGTGIAAVTGAAAGLAIGGAGVALFAAKSANAFFEMSEKTGVSTEALSALAYAAKQSGVSTDSLAGGLEKMNRAVFAAGTAPAGAVNAFTRMGVAVKDSSGNFRSTQDILEDLAAKFKAMPDGPAKTALAMQVFGRSGAELLPLLNQGKDGIQKFSEEAKKLGLVISGETAEQAHVFEQTLDKIEGALTGVSNVVLKYMLPSMQALADFFVGEFKDPSSSFREIGTVLLEVVVPAFKILASAIVVAMTASDYMTAVLSNGLSFVTQQIIGLSNAFDDLKGGHFKEAGEELKAQFEQGLQNFTKGVTDATGSADKRLQDFFAKTWFGANDQSSIQDQSKKKDDTDKSAANQSNPITDRIKKLQEAATAQLALAGATDLSVGAVRAQNEQDQIAKELLDLQTAAAEKHLKVTQQDTDAVKQAVVIQSEAKAVFDVRDSIEKATVALQQHAEAARIMAAAYAQGGSAIADAQTKVAALPLIENLKQTEISLALNKDNLDKNSAGYKQLMADVDAARQALVNFNAESAKGQQADLAKGLEDAGNSLRSQIANLRTEGAAIGGTIEQMRQAAVAAKLASYQAEHPGIDTGSKAWKDYAAAVDEASKQEVANADKTKTAELDLGNVFKNKIADLERYRAQLQAEHADISAVNDAEQQNAKTFIQSYDAMLQKTNSVRNGFQSFFNEVALSAQPAAQQIADVFTNAFKTVNDGLTNLIEGHRNAVREMGKSLEQSVIKQGVSFTTQKAVSGLGNLLGFHLGTGKSALGSSKNNPMFVQEVSAAKSIANALSPHTAGGAAGSSSGTSGSKTANSFTSLLSDVGGKFGGAFKGLFSSLGGIFSKLFSGGSGGGGFSFSSILGSLGGIFSGFRASGGDVQPGHSYIVGENGSERFVPTTPGYIVPNGAAMAKQSQPLVVQAHFHGVQNADSFRASQDHVLNHLATAVSRAVARR
jgi:hypothetical protein